MSTNEEFNRKMERHFQEIWKAIGDNKKRLDYIEPREQYGGAVAYGEIYLNDQNVAQTIATGAGYTKSTAFTTNGEYKNCTPDQANDLITIEVVGRYRVNCNISAKAGKANLNWWGTVFVNGVEQSEIHFKRLIAVAGDVGSMGMSGIIEVTAVPVDIDLRLRHSDPANQNFFIQYGNLNIVYIGALI